MTAAQVQAAYDENRPSIDMLSDLSVVLGSRNGSPARELLYGDRSLGFFTALAASDAIKAGTLFDRAS